MKYSVSPQILQSNDPSQIAWDAIEPIWDDIPFSPFRKLAEFLEELSQGQASLIALDWCQKEIRNGGLRLLFENSTGNLVPWAIRGFHAIGAVTYAQVLDRAAGMLGSPYPQAAAARKRIMADWSPAQSQELEELDTSFFTLLNSPEHDLEPIRGGYVLRHPEQFIDQTEGG